MKHASIRAAAMVSGLIVWFAYFLLVWMLTEPGCALRAHAGRTASDASTRIILIAATLIALSLIAIAGRRGWRSGGFGGTLMFLVALLATVSTLWTAVPIFVLPVCG